MVLLELLRKIRVSLPSLMENGLNELVRLNAPDKLMDLLGNKNPAIRELAACGLAKLRYFAALPGLIYGLNDIEGKTSIDLRAPKTFLNYQK